MFDRSALGRLATAASDHLMQAHRGAVGSGPTVIVFGNDGGLNAPKGEASITNARAVLTADGFRVGRVATDRTGYTWVFEAVPPRSVGRGDALDQPDTAVWQGWAAARNLDPDRDDFAASSGGSRGRRSAGSTCSTCVTAPRTTDPTP